MQYINECNELIHVMSLSERRSLYCESVDVHASSIKVIEFQVEYIKVFKLQ